MHKKLTTSSHPQLLISIRATKPNDTGKEIESRRIKRSKWHNFWNGHTHNLVVDNVDYRLDGAPRQLTNGTHYYVIGADATQQLMGQTASRFEKGGPEGTASITVSETAKKSVKQDQWNWKHTLNRRYPNAFFLYGGAAHASDYIGNVVWGYIMASYGYGEGEAKAAAGLAQFGSDAMDNKVQTAAQVAIFGPVGAIAVNAQGRYYEDPRDTEAIGKGFDWYRYNHPPKRLPRIMGN